METALTDQFIPTLKTWFSLSPSCKLHKREAEYEVGPGFLALLKGVEMYIGCLRDIL
jgi:hypothetical protein